LPDFLKITYEGAIPVRKHLILKLIYAGTFFLLLIGSTFLFMHPGASIVRAASPQSCGSWKVVSSPNPGTSLNIFNGVVALNSGDVWAVGDYENLDRSSGSLIEHWNGTNWRVVSSPDPGNGLLSSVAADASNDIWAVGRWNISRATAFQTLVEHWNGHKWSVVPSPNVGGNINWLQGVTALAPNNVWAVDSTSIAPRSIITPWLSTGMGTSGEL
jgi:hypothetical protein